MNAQHDEFITVRAGILDPEGPLGVPVLGAMALVEPDHALHGVKFLWLGGDEVAFGLAGLDEPSGSLPIVNETGETVVSHDPEGLVEWVSMVAASDVALEHIRSMTSLHILVTQMQGMTSLN
jgi:hypothetical protein